MSLILGIDTTDRRTCVALAENDAVLSEADGGEQGAVEVITGLLEQVLRAGSVDVQAIQAVAIAIGPGSYTGIRTGLATAQGLSAALGCKIIGLCTLLARIPNTVPGIVIPWIPANKNELFSAVFEVLPEADGRVRFATRVVPAACTEAELAKLEKVFATPRLGVQRPESNPAGLLALAAQRLYSVSSVLEMQISADGTGLEPIYAKSANARTLAERAADLHKSVDEPVLN